MAANYWQLRIGARSPGRASRSRGLSFGQRLRLFSWPHFEPLRLIWHKCQNTPILKRYMLFVAFDQNLNHQAISTVPKWLPDANRWNVTNFSLFCWIYQRRCVWTSNWRIIWLLGSVFHSRTVSSFEKNLPFRQFRIARFRWSFNKNFSRFDRSP